MPVRLEFVARPATESWTKSRQWETERTLFSSARISLMCRPAKRYPRVAAFNDAWQTYVVAAEAIFARRHLQRCLHPATSCERPGKSRRTGAIFGNESAQAVFMTPTSRYVRDILDRLEGHEDLPHHIGLDGLLG